MILSEKPPESNSGDTPPAKWRDIRIITINGDRVQDDCGRLACAFCNARNRRQWQSAIRHHLTTHGKRNLMVWVFWCDAIAWGTVSHNLQVKRSSYFRLETTPGRLLVVSSERPTTAAITGPTQVTTEYAAERLRAEIAVGPVREKQLTSSRNWKLNIKKLQAAAQEKRPS